MTRMVGALVGGILAATIATRARAEEVVIPLAGEVPDDGLDHFFVEFDVPEGIVEIEIRHDDLSTINILDWGLEDPNGHRGWGGGNEEPAIVGIDAASRSHVPGPITPGVWRVVVGKAKVSELPGAYQLEVVLRDVATLAPQPERSPYTPSQALARQARWYAGDFHVHSRESGDARPPLDEIAEFARGRGLDFVVITDHNVVTGSDFMVDAQARHPDLLLIPGFEFTTYAGHANAIGSATWVDHKIGQPGVTIESAAQAIRARGALLSINHPTLELGDLCIGCAWNHDLPVDHYDAIEIITGGLAPFGSFSFAGAVPFWEDRLDEGRHLAALGGSDDHRAGVDLNQFQSPIGDPTTLVFAEALDEASILAGIRNGRTVVKLQGPADPMLEIWADELEGDAIVAHDPVLAVTVTGGDATVVQLVRDGSVIETASVSGDPFIVEFPVIAPAGGETRYRAQLLVDGTERVITSHVFVSDGPASGTSTDGSATMGAEAGGETETGATLGESGGEGTAAGSGDGGGCGCRVPPRSGPFGSLLMLVMLTRRRQRRSPW